MDHLENELRNALRRQEAPGDLTARVLARVAREGQREPWWRRWMAAPQLRWAAAATLGVAIAGGTWFHHNRQERQRIAGEEAKREVMVALHIAGAKIQLATGKVQRLSER